MLRRPLSAFVVLALLIFSGCRGRSRACHVIKEELAKGWCNASPCAVPPPAPVVESLDRMLAQRRERLAKEYTALGITSQQKWPQLGEPVSTPFTWYGPPNQMNEDGSPLPPSDTIVLEFDTPGTPDMFDTSMPFKTIPVPVLMRGKAKEYLSGMSQDGTPATCRLITIVRDKKTNAVVRATLSKSGDHPYFKAFEATNDDPAVPILIGLLEDADSVTVEYDKQGWPTTFNLFRD